MLYGTASGNPVHRTAAAALRSVTEPLGARVALYEEFIDQSWFMTAHGGPEPADPEPGLQAFARYLALKYHGISFDLVFAVGAPAYEFHRQLGHTIFPKAPVIACIVPRARAEREAVDSLVTLVADSASFAGAVRVGLQLQPETRHVAIVAGASPFDQRYVPLLPEIRAAIDQDADIITLDGLSLAPLETAVATLPPHTIILYVSVTADSSGASYDSPEVEARIAAAANAPIYDWSDLAFGRGIVGGQLLRLDSSVVTAARLAVRVISGERMATLPRRVMNPAAVLLDWRALRRWNIDEHLAPDGAEIAFRPVTPWSRHRNTIVAVLMVILAQAAVIAALFVQRTRRRRAEAANQILLGQLITAQEAERSRIARELHDNINQKLAALSIGLSRLRRRLPGNLQVLGAEVSELQDRAGQLATDVRQLSHQLHSGVLQHAGLTAAIRALCSDFMRQHSIDVTFVPIGEIDSMTDEVSLCLYRVAQESLRNAATHASASHVGLTIARDDDAISMSIADDGSGFDLDAARSGSGMGLASLEERVRILHGTVSIRSARGAGTEVALRIPAAPNPSSSLGVHDPHYSPSR